MPPTDFIVQTCEARFRAGPQIPFAPSNPTRQIPFETRDPFGLRKAVLPIFKRTPEGHLVGIGTATHVDGWGGFITAEHVLDFLRTSLPQGGLTGQCSHDLDPTTQCHAVVLLGVGLVFGQMAVPNWAFAPVTNALAVSREVDDPLIALQGRQRFEIAIDIAGFQAAISPVADGERYPQVLPLQLDGWEPTVGEQVLAFGYPELQPSAIVTESSLQQLIEDGLFAAYGTVTRVFRQGRDLANPTPVFEVEAYWPSGMSGGPVVNEAGNIIGVVSRSLAPDGELPGIGYAACLPWIGGVRSLAPRVDPLNPGFRIGYGIFSEGQQFLASVWPNSQLAMQQAARLAANYAVRACSHRIGTDEYICL